MLDSVGSSASGTTSDTSRPTASCADHPSRCVRGGVPGEDPAVEVLDDDGVGRALDHGGEQRPGALDVARRLQAGLQLVEHRVVGHRHAAQLGPRLVRAAAAPPADPGRCASPRPRSPPRARAPTGRPGAAAAPRGPPRARDVPAWSQSELAQRGRRPRPCWRRHAAVTPSSSSTVRVCPGPGPAVCPPPGSPPPTTGDAGSATKVSPAGVRTTTRSPRACRSPGQLLGTAAAPADGGVLRERRRPPARAGAGPPRPRAARCRSTKTAALTTTSMTASTSTPVRTTRGASGGVCVMPGARTRRRGRCARRGARPPRASGAARSCGPRRGWRRRRRSPRPA